jgi:hypothetical protein
MIEKTQEIIIDPHFCGPTQSGHGGYTAGIMAGHFEEGAEVTLRRPIPTGRPLKLFSQKTCVRLMDACEEIAIAIPKKVSLEIIEPPTFHSAKQAETFFAYSAGHLYPKCFVCGTDREEGDGFRIFPGFLPEKNFACAIWEPMAKTASVDGRVDLPYLWAVLDCPAYFGLKLGDTYVLTGKIAVEILRRPRVGDACILAGWRTGKEARKHFAASAIFDSQGDLLAKSTSVWIEPRVRGG